MDINDDTALTQLEELLNSVELDIRAREAERDIKHEKVADYREFSQQMKAWLQEKSRIA